MIPQELVNDLQVLKDQGLEYNLSEDTGKVYVVFVSYPLPAEKYNMEKTPLLIFTTPYYPNAAFDMFWVDQNLLLKNGCVPKSAESIESHLGKNWRRFSYHPYNNKRWNPGEDSVINFMSYVQQRLDRGD